MAIRSVAEVPGALIPVVIQKRLLSGVLVGFHDLCHTMASMRYFNGVDSVSISKRLGHAQVSTTANIYAHVMEKADQRNADILADVFLKKA